MPLYRETPTQFHPEFGYLVPTRKLRYTVRVALAAAMFGLITGAVGAMVLFPRIIRDLRIERVASGEPATTVGVAIVAPTDAADPVPATDSSAGQSLAVATSVRIGPAPKASAPSNSAAPSNTVPSVAQNSVVPNSVASPPSAASKSADAGPPATEEDADKPCKEETWPYFDRKCLWGGPAKDAAVPAQAAGTEAAGAVANVAAAPVNPPEQRQVAPRRKAKATAVARRRRDDSDPRTNTRYSRAYGYGYGQFGNPFNSWRGNEQQRGWRW